MRCIWPLGGRCWHYLAHACVWPLRPLCGLVVGSHAVLFVAQFGVAAVACGGVGVWVQSGFYLFSMRYLRRV